MFKAKTVAFFLLGAAITSSGAGSARADGFFHRREPVGWHGRYWRGGPWRGGYWHHGYHDGRLGWWWVLGGAWTFFPRPVYPYPYYYAAPPAVIVQTPPPPPGPPMVMSQAQSWYYCPNPPGYYPYVQACPAGWTPVPATAAPAPPASEMPSQ